jgi:hypothetical protein
MAKHFVLNTGAKIPSVGLGTWQSDPGVVGDAVYAAVKVPHSRAPPPLPHLFRFFPHLAYYVWQINVILFSDRAGGVSAHRLRQCVQQRKGGNLVSPKL